jgi:SAM-dependent methyltransferase
MTGPAEFDQYAADYDASVAHGLAVTGESKDFFAAGRARWLHRRLQQRNAQPHNVLDFGCGIGSATPHLLAIPGIRSVTGIDVSEASIEQARSLHAGSAATFASVAEFTPDGSFDLAYCSGVFHHIPVGARAAAVQTVYDSLRPGGLFAFCEHNPWNPGTRWVMSRIEFDRDAVLVWPRQARRMVEAAGFRVLRTDFLFVFPHPLAALRPLEQFLVRLPLGGQYMMICEKTPAADTSLR